MDTRSLPVDRQIDQFNAQVRRYMRTLARGRIGHNPSNLQKLVIRRAALADAEVDRVFADPGSSSNDRIRALNAAHLMHSRMEAELADARPPAREPSYSEIMAMADQP